MIIDGLDQALIDELNQHYSIMNEEVMGKGNKPSGAKKDKLKMKKKVKDTDKDGK